MISTDVVNALSALANPTRLRAFKLLVQASARGVPAGEIARLVGVPVTTMSTHLAVLSRAGVISPRRESRTIYYALNIDGTRELLVYLLADCCGGRPDLCGPVFQAKDPVCCAPLQNESGYHEPV